MGNNRDASIINQTDKTLYVLVDNPEGGFIMESVAPHQTAKNVEVVIKPDFNGQIHEDCLSIRLPSGKGFTPTFKINDDSFVIDKPWSRLEATYLKFANSFVNGNEYGKTISLKERFALEPCFKAMSNPEIIRQPEQSNQADEPSNPLSKPDEELPTSSKFRNSVIQQSGSIITR